MAAIDSVCRHHEKIVLANRGRPCMGPGPAQPLWLSAGATTGVLPFRLPILVRNEVKLEGVRAMYFRADKKMTSRAS